MRTQITSFILTAILVIASGSLNGSPVRSRSPLELTVLTQGSPSRVYSHQGRFYIEARKGAEFSIRLTNHSAGRIAVALTVDGLNTIDARHTTPQQASKWVLAPWQTVTIDGWQINRNQARKFYFTTEDDSYGAALGRKTDLGIISAAVFREIPPVTPIYRAESRSRDTGSPAPRSALKSECQSSADSATADEYAATGMGQAVSHRVHRVNLQLEPTPCQSIGIRYEFRPVLVRLGVLPAVPDPLLRRERAHGFDTSFCPQPADRHR